LSIVSEFTGINSSSSTPSACPVCSSVGPFPQRPAAEGFRLFECTKCGIVFLFPQPQEAELAALYDETYYGEGRKKFLSPVEAGIAALSYLKWKNLQSVLGQGGRLLDIGCGRGTLLGLARASGFEAYGLERPSTVGHSIPGILYKSLPECNFPDGHFQVVVLWHVLEHLPDPVAMLREISRILQPGGWLSVAVPNYGGAQAQASGPLWFHMDLPRHFWQFRLSSLQALLVSNGFRVARYTTFSLEYDWFGTLQSWMNRAFQDDNQLYSLLKGNDATTVAKKMLRITAATFVALPAFGSALWDAVRGQGGTLNVMAQRVGAE